MKSKAFKYTEYCSACGLCKAKELAEIKFEGGFFKPEIKGTELDFFENVCPVSGSKYEIQPEWGLYNNVYVGFSTDSELRHQASSGGVISAIASYMLDNKLIDGVIHTGKDDEKPWRTKTYCSKTSEEVQKRCGSRYSQSMPLADIFDLTEQDKKYIYIGKPCDVQALYNYFKIDPDFQKRFVCVLSFFCAGAPSENAQMKLLNTLNCSAEECVDLRYRGNGWPGFATAFRKDGSSDQISYSDSWGKILGRDIRKSCKFCMNGTGEPADISCGDAWYAKPDGSPDFTESEGRNIIFTRSLLGEKILTDAISAGYIKAEDYSKEIVAFLSYWNFCMFLKPSISFE